MVNIINAPTLGGWSIPAPLRISSVSSVVVIKGLVKEFQDTMTVAAMDHRATGEQRVIVGEYVQRFTRVQTHGHRDIVGFRERIPAAVFNPINVLCSLEFSSKTRLRALITLLHCLAYIQEFTSSGIVICRHRVIFFGGLDRAFHDWKGIADITSAEDLISLHVHLRGFTQVDQYGPDPRKSVFRIPDVYNVIPTYLQVDYSVAVEPNKRIQDVKEHAPNIP
ncbi:hypothetical protein FN846DRAFT_912953 [Sphaerosporella brunnea]|uniref:Uncharacterized protein n=1 Tax=Sphaerosporella brunnea TaxID=1250544 RepID=A0A5J5EGL2_9PEZI|nr:hypothetical protein FN846DRAFT_912953 [Sphaerosporella brunnea]